MACLVSRPLVCWSHSDSAVDQIGDFVARDENTVDTPCQVDCRRCERAAADYHATVTFVECHARVGFLHSAVADAICVAFSLDGNSRAILVENQIGTLIAGSLRPFNVVSQVLKDLLKEIFKRNSAKHSPVGGQKPMLAGLRYALKPLIRLSRLLIGHSRCLNPHLSLIECWRQ